MIDLTILVAIGIVLALAFDFGNGRNDAANAVSTVVATRVLSLEMAVVLSAFFNFLAAFVFSTEVASTIGKGIVDPAFVNVYIIISALLSAILWIYGLAWVGVPISSSHSLIGGLVGAAIAAAGVGSVNAVGVGKIIAFIFIAPFIGMIFSYVFSLIVFYIVRRTPPATIQHHFRYLQLISVSVYSMGHGSNDAQKTAGIIALLLFTGGFMGDTFHIPFWVIVISYVTIAIGTLVGGRAIVKTMATKITKLRPIDGFCAETSGAGVILGCSHFGIPVSTTHVIAGSISGVGVLKRSSAVSWNVARRIVYAWFLTIPLTAFAGALIYYLLAFIAGFF